MAQRRFSRVGSVAFWQAQKRQGPKTNAKEYEQKESQPMMRWPNVLGTGSGIANPVLVVDLHNSVDLINNRGVLSTVRRAAWTITVGR